MADYNIDELLRNNSSDQSSGLLSKLGGYAKDAARFTAGAAASGLSGFLGAVPQLVGLGASGLSAAKKFAEPAMNYIKPVTDFIDPENTPLSRLLGLNENADTLSTVSEYAGNASPEAIKGYIDEATGGYTKPTGPVSRAVQSTIQDISSLVGTPGIGVPKTVMAGIAAGNSAYEALKEANVPEGVATGVKLAIPFLTPAVIGTGRNIFNSNRRLLRRAYTNLYSKADKLLNKNAAVSADELLNSVGNIRKLTESGLGTAVPEKRAVMNIADKIRSSVSDGKISVSSLVDIKKDLNSLRRLGNKSAQRSLTEIGRAVRDTISQYGAKDKNWLNAFNEAEAVFAADKARPIFNKLKNIKLSSDPGTNELAKLVLGIAGAPAVAPMAAMDQVASAVMGQLRSPEARRLMGQALKSPAKATIPSIVSFAKKIGKAENQYGSKGDTVYDFLKISEVNEPSSTTISTTTPTAKKIVKKNNGNKNNVKESNNFLKIYGVYE